MVPRSGAARPKSALASVVRPEPRRPATPSTSPRAQREGHALEGARFAQPRDLQQRGRVRRQGGGRRGGHVAPRHGAGERGGVELRRRPLGHERAVPQHHDPLADLQHLGELVADEEHRHPVRLEPPDDLQQPAHLALRQRGGGLVHDDEARVGRQRSADRHELLVRDRQRLDPSAERQLDADALQHLGRAGAHAAPAVEARALRPLGLERDVLGHGEVREEAEVLEDDLDARRARHARRDPALGAAVEEHLPLIVALHAHEHLDEGGLARPVLAREAHRLAGADRQVHRVERGDRAVALGHAAHRDDGRRRAGAGEVAARRGASCRAAGRGGGVGHGMPASWLRGVRPRSGGLGRAPGRRPRGARLRTGSRRCCRRPRPRKPCRR